MNNSNRLDVKQQALDIGMENFSVEILKPKYLELLSQFS